MLSVPLRGDELIRIELPAVSHAPLSLRFDRWITDSANRRLSFLVLETNLFEEADLNAGHSFSIGRTDSPGSNGPTRKDFADAL